MSIVTDFKSIKRILDRQEQKAEFEAKNPAVDTGMYGWPYGVAVPLKDYASAPSEWNDYYRALVARRVKI